MYLVKSGTRVLVFAPVQPIPTVTDLTVLTGPSSPWSRYTTVADKKYSDDRVWDYFNTKEGVLIPSWAKHLINRHGVSIIHVDFFDREAYAVVGNTEIEFMH